MHELGTVLYIIDTVEKTAEEHSLSEVSSVTVEVGEVSGIVPSYISDFWLYARKNSALLAETEMKIVTLPAVTFCEDCRGAYPTVQYGKRCPHCGSDKTYLLCGNEYNIKEIEGC